MKMREQLLAEIKEARLERSGNGMNTDFLVILGKVLSKDIPFEYSPADFIHELTIEVNKMNEED